MTAKTETTTATANTGRESFDQYVKRLGGMGEGVRVGPADYGLLLTVDGITYDVLPCTEREVTVVMLDADDERALMRTVAQRMLFRKAHPNHIAIHGSSEVRRRLSFILNHAQSA